MYNNSKNQTQMLKFKKITLLFLAVSTALFLQSCSDDDGGGDSAAEAVGCVNISDSLVKGYEGAAVINGTPIPDITATVSTDGEKDGCNVYKITFDKADDVISGIQFIEGENSFDSADSDQGVSILKADALLSIGTSTGLTFDTDAGGGTADPGTDPVDTGGEDDNGDDDDDDGDDTDPVIPDLPVF